MEYACTHTYIYIHTHTYTLTQEKFIVQGMHMLFDGTLGGKWDGVRKSKLVFIGKKLENQDFEVCVCGGMFLVY